MKEEVTRFMTYIGHKHPNRSTAKHYQSDLRIFMRFVGSTKLREVTIKTIDAFVAHQSDRHLKPKTINRRLAAVSSFFQFLIGEAEDDRWQNPVVWKRHRIQRGHHLPRDVDDVTVDKLLDSIHDARDLAMFTLMVKAGLRVGEVAALNSGDLELPGPDRLARLRVRGKGDKERVVWLTPQTWLQLHAWLSIRSQSDDAAMFLNQHKRRLSVAGIQYRLKTYCQQIGMTMTCHQLRHTFARRLAEQKMPIDSLAKLMGHNDLQTTQLYIDGADPTVKGDFLEAITRLDDLMPATATANGPALPVFPPVEPEMMPDLAEILHNLAHLTADLPPWLRQELTQHTRQRMMRWTAHQVQKQTRFHYGILANICRWLHHERDWQQLSQLQRQDLVAYVHYRQAAGIKASSISSELKVFRIFWRDLLSQERVMNGAILLVKPPAIGDKLPRYLTGNDYLCLVQTVEAETQAHTMVDRFNLAWFYLLAHGGLRVSEATNVRLSDCDWRLQRLRVRSGKGNRDRVIPMTAQLTAVLQNYLMVRAPAPTDHLLIYKGKAVNTSLLQSRLARWSQLAEIEKVTPHRLRHTLATLLVNAEMPIVSLQKFLGHQDINQTLVYAKVHDATVRKQFAAAMKESEAISRMQVAPTQCNEAVTLSPTEENRLGVSSLLHQVEKNVSIFTDSV